MALSTQLAEPITLQDLLLINSLSSRKFSDNSLLSNATLSEKEHLKVVTDKLKKIGNYFAEKYNPVYGPFETSVSTGNPIAIGGTSFKRVWSGIFKGARNKQYAAQISFVMNEDEPCLDVGFYFGRASGHSFNAEERKELEMQLKRLGTQLSDAIIIDEKLRERYHSLFDFGFTAYAKGSDVTAEEWYNIIRIDTKKSQLVAKVYPNDFSIIEYSTIDAFVSQVIFLMGTIREFTEVPRTVTIAPLTPEQRAKQAERLAQIGLKGELFVMQFESARLKKLGLNTADYPKHLALESMHYGFDVLSLNERKEEIYIEVKTTTRQQTDPAARRFFISNNEFDVFSDSASKYQLYRVYNVENEPALEIVDLASAVRKPDGYIIEY